MDFNLFGGVVSEVEDILRGISQKMESITREEWLDNYQTGSDVCKNEEERISFGKMMYRQELKARSEYQLAFEDMEDAGKKMDRAFGYVTDCKLSFNILELVFYAMVSMIYFSMRKRDAEDIEAAGIFIKESVIKLTEREEEKKYLEILNKILFLNMAYLYNTMNGSKNECDLEHYKEENEKLLDMARQILPNGEIIELMDEIFLVEEFFKNPTKENINRVKHLCFDKKKNWMGHICICSSQPAWSVDEPWMHYLPHVSFYNSSDNKKCNLEHILDSKPRRIHEIFGLPAFEEPEWEKDFQHKLQQWEEEAYKKIFMQPYEIHTDESKGQLIYTLLSVLADNMELEETKNSIVSDFTHSYGNYEIDNVYHIAKALSDNPSKEELEDYSRELLLEYLNKQMMSKEIRMLNLEHKDKFSELHDVIVRSIDSAQEGVKIHEIIDESLKRVILRILLETGNKRIEDIINKYENKGIDSYELLEYFEKSVIRGEQNCMEWVSDNMNILRVEVSEEWQRLGFRRNSEGNVFLMSLFMELLFNMFTYADINHDMKFILDFMDMDDDTYFVVRTENFVDEGVKSNTKKGLSARNRILGKLNFGSGYRWKNSILKEYRENNTQCTVSARIKSDLFGGIQ